MSHYFIFGQNILYASVIFMVASFCIAFYFLRRQKVRLIESICLSLAAMVSGVWLYEMAYHFSFPDTLTIKNIVNGMLTLNFNTTNNVYPLLWSIIMAILPFMGIRYMKINWIFIGIFVFSIASFLFWILIGYPNLFNPEWWPSSQPHINLISLELQHTTSPDIIFWGGFFNSITKILVVVPSLLFIKTKRDLQGG